MTININESYLASLVPQMTYADGLDIDPDLSPDEYSEKRGRNYF